jgi:hypothetical protein
MRRDAMLIEGLRILVAGLIYALPSPARAQAAVAGPVQSWGLPPLPPGVGALEKFADVSGTP